MPSATFTNPLKVQLGDPYVLHTHGMYYMYGTGGADHGFAAYSSKDLVNWTKEGQVYFSNNKNGFEGWRIVFLWLFTNYYNKMGIPYKGVVGAENTGNNYYDFKYDI